MGSTLSKIFSPRDKSAWDKRFAKWFVVGVIFALYVLFFPLLHQTFGWISVSLSWCFIGLAVWFWGLRGGVSAAIFGYLLNVVLLKNIGGELLGGPIAFILSVSVAAILGRLRDLNLRLRTQFSERKEIEEALRNAQDALELRVAQRTADLEAANEQLQREAAKRTQTLELLQESESRYKELVQHANSIILRFDTQGRITFFNEYAQSFFGYTEDEILHQNIIGTILPETESSGRDLVAMTKDIIRNPTRYANNENENTRRNGERIWIAWTNKAIVDQDGRISEILSIGIDITERKQAAEALKESEATLTSIIRAAPIGIGVVSNRILKSVNERFCAMVGYSSDELVGQSASMIYPSEEEFRWVGKEKYAQIREHGTGTVKTRLKCKDGSIIDVTLSSSPINPADLSAGVTFTALDITERKQADEAIRESEERFRVLFEHAPDPFYINKMDGTIVDGNKAAEEFMGYKKEELIGTNFFETGILSGEDSPKALKLLEQNQKGKPTGPDEFIIYRKNGVPAYAEITTHPVNIKGKKLVLGIARDISERKKAEEETRKLEAQLRQAQKMEAIGTLAGGIAHDFNNILSAIIGFTEISIRDVPPGSKLEDNLQRVLNAGIRAGDLVKQILTFSRQTAREIKPVQVKPIAQEALKLIRASVPSTIEIHQDIGSGSLILGDPTQVHQIIMNLCTNAAHAMQDTGGRMVVSLTDVELGADVSDPHPDMAPGPFIKLTVNDSGPGIAPEIKDRIFDPFFTTKELGEGTGLGLSVVHGIVKDCGGMVSVENTPGEGSIFNVFFPVIESRHGTEIVTHAHLPTGTERILFVDDEEYQVEMGKQVLELLGYRVTTKTSSQEALKVFRAKPDKFDLVVTDLTMPKMTGDVLAKEIMAIRSDVPVILCTGYSEKITPAKAKALGIKEVVMKPAVVEEIARTVRRVLDQTIED